MSALTADDPHYWGPIKQVLDYVEGLIQPGWDVLEIGPGKTPFSKATEFVDNKPPSQLIGIEGKPFHQCDGSNERLPFPDKSYSFVYARHILEDMVNPFLLCREMQRIGKAGYIETPSPIAEFCRGIDGNAPSWRGYHHHRWIVWPVGNELRFVTKFPIIEHIGGGDESAFPEMLKADPMLWNSYFLWTDSFDVRHLECPFDFMITENYPALLLEAMTASRDASAALHQRIMAKPPGDN